MFDEEAIAVHCRDFLIIGEENVGTDSSKGPAYCLLINESGCKGSIDRVGDEMVTYIPCARLYIQPYHDQTTIHFL